jgi:hypothetical protein
MTSESEEGRESRPGCWGHCRKEGNTMARMKQMHLDIIESQDDEEGIINSVPTPVPSPAWEVANAEVSPD